MDTEAFLAQCAWFYEAHAIAVDQVLGEEAGKRMVAYDHFHLTQQRGAAAASFQKVKATVILRA